MKDITEQIVEILSPFTEISISLFDKTFIQKSIQRRIQDNVCNNAEEYISLLKKNKEEKFSFEKSLHIGYSEFFRNTFTFSVMEHLILPSLILNKRFRTNKEIRIWSAACSGGEEAYSIAMLLEEMKRERNCNINYRIFATDINPERLEEAAKGQYTMESMNNMSVKRLSKWLIKRGNYYLIKPELKANVEFSVFDLFDAQHSCPPTSIFGDFDLIICANLLFYYKPMYRKIILDKVNNCLADEGYIVTGETERDILLKLQFREIYSHSAIFVKK